MDIFVKWKLLIGLSSEIMVGGSFTVLYGPSSACRLLFYKGEMRGNGRERLGTRRLRADAAEYG